MVQSLCTRSTLHGGVEGLTRKMDSKSQKPYLIAVINLISPLKSRQQAWRWQTGVDVQKYGHKPYLLKA
eukprot:1139441-Pelagomonas_calceolata.AAC.1